MTKKTQVTIRRQFRTLVYILEQANLKNLVLVVTGFTGLMMVVTLAAAIAVIMALGLVACVAGLILRPYARKTMASLNQLAARFSVQPQQIECGPGGLSRGQRMYTYVAAPVALKQEAIAAMSLSPTMAVAPKQKPSLAKQGPGTAKKKQNRSKKVLHAKKNCPTISPSRPKRKKCLTMS